MCQENRKCERIAAKDNNDRRIICSHWESYVEPLRTEFPKAKSGGDFQSGRYIFLCGKKQKTI